MKQQSEKKSKQNIDPGSTENRQAVDKAPGKEKGKTGKVTEKDLKGKKIDADPSHEEGRPVQ